MNKSSAVEVIDLAHYWHVVRRQLKKIIALSVVATIIAVLVVLSLTPKFSATTTLLIESEEARILSIEEVYGMSGNSSEYLLTQFEILKSRALAQRVVNELNLINEPEYNPFHKMHGKNFSLKALIIGDAEPPTEAEVLAKTVDTFWEFISISPVRKTQLVKISVESESPELAAKASNAVANAYIQSQLEAKVGLTKQAVDWLSERMGGLKDRLNDSENKLQGFRDDNKLVDVKGVGTLIAKELDHITEKLVDARSSRLEYQSTYEQLQAIKELNYESLSDLPVILRNPLVIKLRENESTAELKVSELSKRYGPKHPRMIAAQSDLVAVQHSMLVQMKRLANGIKNDFLTAKVQEKSLGQALKNAKAEVTSINRTEFALSGYVREVKGNRTLYDTFLKRIRETSETGSLQTANARIIDPAVMPQKPVKPKKSLIVALVMVMSLMFGVALAFLLDALDATIKNAEEVDHKLGFGLLGILPLLKTNKDKIDVQQSPEKAPIRAFVHGDNTGFKESVRTLRTGVTLASLESPVQVMLFTSTVPGEGKTTTSANFSAACGQMEKVLLIDADMRRPTIAKQLNLPANSKGLSNAVAYPDTLDESIHHVEDLNIDVMPSGPIPPNPLELLASKNFQAVLAQLKGRYQKIIIDSAPTHIVSDAAYLSTLVDGVVYVIKADSTNDKLVKSGLKRLDESNARILGVVLNQLDLEKEAKYGGDYSYSYGAYDYSTNS